MTDKKIISEIEATMNKMAESFAEKDIEKYLNLYSKKEDLVIYGSMQDEKWTDITEYKKSVIKDWERSEKMEVVYDWLSIKTKGDSAWVATDVQFIAHIGDQKMSVPGRLTAVLTKEGSNWKFVQTHFSMAMPNQQ